MTGTNWQYPRLFPEAVQAGGLTPAAAGLLSGAEADQREQLTVAARPEPGSTGLGVVFALLTAVNLDVVPESLA